MRRPNAPLVFFVVAVLCFGVALSAQRRVDPRYSYHRVIAVVPLVGAGSPEDPIRGKYVPTPQTAGPPGTGIIAFAVELTDDGKRAIVELVAVQRATLARSWRTVASWFFEKGVARAADVESAIQPLRKDFSLQTFGVPIQ
jgi:hypothetical protein